MTTLDGEHIRMVEAVLFAAEEPLDASSIAKRLPRDIEVEALLEAVRAKYEQAGFHLVKIDKKYFRETEVDNLVGNYSKAKKILKWKPKTNIKELVKEMVNSELKK